MADTSDAAALIARVFDHHLRDFVTAWDRLRTTMTAEERIRAWSLVAAAVAERDTGRG